MIIHVIVRHKPVPVFGREKASALPRKFLIFVVPVVKDAKENQTCRRTSNNQIQQNEALERFLSQYSVRSLLLFRRIVEIERFALLVAILDERQIYVGGGGRFGRRRQK